jgi:hypothetical protein
VAENRVIHGAIQPPVGSDLDATTLLPPTRFYDCVDCGDGVLVIEIMINFTINGVPFEPHARFDSAVLVKDVKSIILEEHPGILGDISLVAWSGVLEDSAQFYASTQLGEPVWIGEIPRVCRFSGDITRQPSRLVAIAAHLSVREVSALLNRERFHKLLLSVEGAVLADEDIFLEIVQRGQVCSTKRDQVEYLFRHGSMVRKAKFDDSTTVNGLCPWVVSTFCAGRDIDLDRIEFHISISATGRISAVCPGIRLRRFRKSARNTGAALKSTSSCSIRFIDCDLMDF